MKTKDLVSGRHYRLHSDQRYEHDKAKHGGMVGWICDPSTGKRIHEVIASVSDIALPWEEES